MKPNESAQIEFIKDCLRNGEKRGEVLAKFVEKWQNVSSRTFDRRLNDATEAMGIELERIVSQTDKAVKKEVEARKLKLMTVAERMDVLSKIANGEIPLFKPMVVNGVVEMIDVVPDWMDRKNAIAELNKMDGSYSATKTEVSFAEPQVFRIGGKEIIF